MFVVALVDFVVNYIVRVVFLVLVVVRCMHMMFLVDVMTAFVFCYCVS